MKYIPVSTSGSSGGTFKAERVDKLKEAFPNKKGVYTTNVGGGYFPIYQGSTKRLKKCRAPFVWEKLKFLPYTTPGYTTEFIEDKNVVIAAINNEVHEWNVDTLASRLLFTTPTATQGFIWDSANQRFIILLENKYTSGTTGYFHSTVATCKYDGSSYTVRGDFTIAFQPTSSDYYANATFAFHNKKIYISYGSNNYNSSPHKHGMTVIDTTTWSERRIGDLNWKPRMVRADSANNVILLSSADYFGMVDASTDVVYSAPSMKDGEAHKWPCLQALGFKSGDYVAQATTYFYRDANSRVRYKCMIEASRFCATTALQYKHWMFDLDIQKLKTDPINCLSNPTESIRNTTHGRPEIGKPLAVINNDKLKEMTVFTFTSGQGGSSTVFFGVSLDGGLHINHPMGASRTSNDYSSYTNTFSYWHDVMFKNGDIYFCGMQGIGKITPVAREEQDLMCAWHDSPKSEPVAVSKSRWAQFWFGGDA